MRKKMNLLTASVLLAGSVLAQEGFDSVEDVMTELMNYAGEQAPAAEVAAPSAIGADAPAEAPAKGEGKPAVAVKPTQTSSAVENRTAVVESDAQVARAAVQPRVEETAVQVVPEASVAKESELTRDEKIAALVERYAGEIDTDELLRLIDQINRNETDSVEELQELANLIKKSKPKKDGILEYLPALLKSEQRWKYLWTLLMSEPRKHTVETAAIEAVDAAWSADLVLQSFALVPGAGTRLRLGNTTRAVDVEMLFSLVNFPKGASAVYQPQTEAIYVTNTRENLAVLETMLETMGVLKGFSHSDQVEIEAKFVEVSEGTLEELGFQWNFADPTRAGNVDVTDGPDGLFSDALRGSSVPFGRPIDLGDGTVAPSGDWSTFRFVDTFGTEPGTLAFQNTGGNEFDVLIRALDQNSGADVLSAPRILTRSGEEASIQVGELHYFPEVFEGDAAQATIINVSYEDFNEKLLGVELTVTPKVNDDREIMLELNPRITELAGWQSYQLAPGSFDENPSPIFTSFKGSHYNHRQLDTAKPYTDHDPIVGNLPIFKKREIKTQVTMADGSTIGMGGLINEKIEKFEDKVPVLGSIPLVGRLFRSEGERAVKRNLIMFVTANIIDPNGQVETSRSME